MREIKRQLKTITKNATSIEELLCSLSEDYSMLTDDEDSLTDLESYDMAELADTAKVKSLGSRVLAHTAIATYHAIITESAPHGYLLMLHIYSKGRLSYFALFE